MATKTLTQAAPEKSSPVVASNGAPAPMSVNERVALRQQSKRERDELIAKAQEAYRQSQEALRVAKQAVVTKSLEEVIDEEKTTVANWMIARIVARIAAREKAGQDRGDAIEGMLDTFRDRIVAEFDERDVKRNGNGK